MEDETNKEKTSNIENVQKNPVTEAQNVLAKLEEQNQIMRNNINELQELKATEMLSGSANAGQEIKPRTDNDVVNDQAKAMLEGSGYEDIQLD